MRMVKRENYLGTYFNKDAVLRLAKIMKIMAWIVLVIFGGQIVLSIGVYTLQILRGFWAGMGITDMIQNYLSAFAQPLQGIIYSFVLWGISQLLKIFLDIEDNTRRSARGNQDR